VRTRLVEVDDAAAIREIYNVEIGEASVTFDLVARSAEDQLEWIDRHRGAHAVLVAVAEPDEGDADLPRGAAGDAVLGFASLSPFRERPAYATTVEDSVYVHRRARGRGVGRRLLEDLLVAARDAGFHAVIARIISTNEGSIRLHRTCGFEHVGVEHEVGRKHGRWLDVVELERLL